MRADGSVQLRAGVRDPTGWRALIRKRGFGKSRVSEGDSQQSQVTRKHLGDSNAPLVELNERRFVPSRDKNKKLSLTLARVTLKSNVTLARVTLRFKL